MQINIVSCKTEEDYNEIIELLKEKYKIILIVNSGE